PTLRPPLSPSPPLFRSMDFVVFPGNSGGPVFMPPDPSQPDRPFVAGVLTQQVELNSEHLGIGVVTHAAYVREAIALLDQAAPLRSEEYTSGLQSRENLV